MYRFLKGTLYTGEAFAHSTGRCIDVHSLSVRQIGIGKFNPESAGQ